MPARWLGSRTQLAHQLGEIYAVPLASGLGGRPRKPNSAYIVDRDGVIAFRSLFATDERSLHEALTAIVTGKDLTRSQSQAMFRPMARAIGYIQEVLGRAGAQAKQDMWFAGPPFVIAGMVAGLFSSLALEKRGAPAMAILAAMLVGGLSGIFFLLA